MRRSSVAVRNRLCVDNCGVGHSDQLVRHRVPRSQDVEPLTTRGSADEDPRERPQAAEKRAEYKVSGVHEEHVTLTGYSGVQFRFQLGVEKLGLVLNVLGQVFLAARG